MRAGPKRFEQGRKYLSPKLDDPSFDAPIYANLFEDECGSPLVAVPQKRQVSRAWQAPAAKPAGAWSGSGSSISAVNLIKLAEAA